MSDKPPIPSLPPLSSVQDRNVRAVLQSLYDGWRVRNGDVGSGEHKFLTIKDLKDVFTLGRIPGAGGTLTTSQEGSAGLVSTIISKIADSVMQSRMWKLLDERIQRIDTPEWFQGKFGAAVRSEQLERESADNALAEEITTAVTNINGNIALVQTALTATSDLAGATASSVTTLQTEVAGTTAVAQEAFNLSQTVDGRLSSAWTVKVDANGYVAGMGFGVDGKSGTYQSNFTVRADQFAIGSPSGTGITPTVPFVVYSTPQVINGQQVLPGVYLKDAFIANGTIDSAQIGTLAVQTLNIAGNAVTVPGYAEGSSLGSYDPGSLSLSKLALTLSYSAPATVLVICSIVGGNAGGSTNVRCRLRVGGTVIADRSTSLISGWTDSYTFVASATIHAGARTFYVDLGNDWVAGGPWEAQNVSLIVMGAMK